MSTEIEELYVTLDARTAGFEEGMDRAKKSGSGWIGDFKQGLKELVTGPFAAGAVLATIGLAFTKSVQASDELDASIRKLGGTAKLTNIPLKDLEDLANGARDAFKLSTPIANDFATEISKLTQKAGDVGKSKDALAAFLELGAARGLSAAESLKAVQQSVLGIDEGTDKLFGKNPSALYEEYAKAIGTTAGKLTDQQKAQALLTAALEDGDKVRGSYQAYLDSTAGQQEQLRIKTEELGQEFGAAVAPLRLLTLEMANGLLPAVSPLVTVFAGALSSSVITVTKLFNLLRQVVITVASGYGQLTGNADLVRWAGEQATASEQLRVRLNELSEQAVRLVTGQKQVAQSARDVNFSITEVIPNAQRARTAMSELNTPLGDTGRFFGSAAIGAKELAGGNKDATQSLKPIGPLAKLTAAEIAAYGTMSVKTAKEVKAEAKQQEEAYRSLREGIQFLNREMATLQKEWAKGIDALEASVVKGFGKSQQVIGDTNKTLRDIREAGDQAFKSITDTPLEAIPSLEKLQSKLRLAGGDIETAARAALDFGTAFDIIDDKTKNALTSVINIGAALPKALTGDFTALGGVVGGIASIAKTITAGDPERRKLLADNTKAIDRLRQEGVSLSDKASGAAIAGTTSVLNSSDFVKALLQAEIGNGPQAQRQLIELLAAQGLRLSDLDAVAGDLGVKIRRDNGDLDFRALAQLAQALVTLGPSLTRVGQSFSEQLDFFRTTQGLVGSTGTRQISDLVTFLRDVGGVRAFDGLNADDPAALRNALFDLFTNLNNGGLSGGALGRLSGTAFRDVLLELIGLVDNLKNAEEPSAEASPTSPATSAGTAAGAAAGEAAGTAVGTTLSDTLTPALDRGLAFLERIAIANERTVAVLTEAFTVPTIAPVYPPVVADRFAGLRGGSAGSAPQVTVNVTIAGDVIGEDAGRFGAELSLTLAREIDAALGRLQRETDRAAGRATFRA